LKYISISKSKNFSGLHYISKIAMKGSYMAFERVLEQRYNIACFAFEYFRNCLKH